MILLLGEVLITVPLPVPALVTLRVKDGTFSAKVAVTVLSLSIVTVQLPVPEHSPPLQPVKSDFASGEANKVTGAPES